MIEASVSSTANRYVVIWEFEIRLEMQSEFLQMYAPDGAWARLFTSHGAYGGTELVRDVSNPVRFVTIDRWRSRKECEQFRSEHQADYEALDLACEAIMLGERKIGEFEILAD